MVMPILEDRLYLCSIYTVCVAQREQEKTEKVPLESWLCSLYTFEDTSNKGVFPNNEHGGR